jgi:hypothetical protein
MVEAKPDIATLLIRGFVDKQTQLKHTSIHPTFVVLLPEINREARNGFNLDIGMHCLLYPQTWASYYYTASAAHSLHPHRLSAPNLPYVSFVFGVRCGFCGWFRFVAACKQTRKFY